jgi:hypothetical protein
MGRLRRTTVAFPDRAILVLFWVSLVVAAAVLAGQFRPLLVVPAAAVVVVLSWRLVPAPMAPSRANVTGALVAVVLVAVWLIANVAYVSRYVVVTRDPGFLTLEAFWLTGHPDPGIPVGVAGVVADNVYNADATGAALGLSEGTLHVQGAKLLPGLLAVAGWAGGDKAVLVGNLAIGAVALLALYALARRLVGPVWGLLPLVAMSVSMPMIVFSRAAYTEPLALALAFGGMTMIWSGFETRTPWRHLVGAAMVGATALVRIDGAAVVIGLVAGFGLVAGAAVAPRIRRTMTRVLVGVVVVGVAMALLGWLDLLLHSPKYLADLAQEYSQLAAALLACALVSLAVALPGRWDGLRRLVLRRRATLAWWAVGAVALMATLLISRPLWMVNHNLPPDSGYSALVASLQANEGVAVDGTRSYDEMSVTWLAWYFGWPMVVLAFAGLALVLHRAIAKRDPRWLVIAAIIGAPSALYLVRVSITPDQIWATRRLLPLTMPGLVLMATIALVGLWRTRHAWARVLAGALAIAVAVAPAMPWRSGLFTAIEQEGRYGEALAVCDALPTPRIVVVGSRSYVPTLRILCDAEVVAFRTAPSEYELTGVREHWGGGEIAVMTFSAEAVPWEDPGDLQPFLVTNTSFWGNAVSHIPDAAVRAPSYVFLGVITEDGRVASMSPSARE